MAGYRYEKDVELGGTIYLGKTTIDSCEKMEEALDMGMLEILRAAARPTITTKQIITVLGMTLFRKIGNQDLTMKPVPIGEAGARALVDKVGYFEGTKAVLGIISLIFAEVKTEGGEEAA